MSIFSVLLLVIVGTSTVSARGTVITGYAVSSGTFTDNTCTTAISYAIRPLGCVQTGQAASDFYSAADATTGSILVTSYTSIDCTTGAASSDSTYTSQVCTCVTGGSCTKRGYYSASIPAMPGPYQTQQTFDGATVCTGTPTDLFIYGFDPASNGAGCSQSACSQSTSNNVAQASWNICTVPTGTLTGFIQRISYADKPCASSTVDSLTEFPLAATCTPYGLGNTYNGVVVAGTRAIGFMIGTSKVSALVSYGNTDCTGAVLAYNVYTITTACATGSSSMIALSPTAYVAPAATVMYVQKTYSTRSACTLSDSTAVAYTGFYAQPTCAAVTTPASASTDSNTYPNTGSSIASCSATSVPIASVSTTSTGFGLIQSYSTSTCSGTPRYFSYVPLNVCRLNNYDSTSDYTAKIRTFTYTYTMLTAATVSGVTTFTESTYTTKDCMGTATKTSVLGASAASGCASASTASDYFSLSLTTTSSAPSGFSGFYMSAYSTQAGCTASATSALVNFAGISTACTQYITYVPSSTPTGTPTPVPTPYYSTTTISSLNCKTSGTSSWKANAMSSTVGILIAAVTCLLIV